MPGSKHRRKKKISRSKSSAGSAGNVPREATPKLPTSGQILGVLVRSLGITHPNLGDKTAQRYFSGRLESRVKESSRDKIIAAISETLAASIFVATPVREEEGCSSDSSWLAAVLDWHAVNWDRCRAFLRPRMMRVYPDHWALVWRAYVRLAAIDLALRAAAHVHIAGASPDALEFLHWTGVGRRGEYLSRKRREAGVSLYVLAESTGVSDNTVAAWLYEGARPSDDNLTRSQPEGRRSPGLTTQATTAPLPLPALPLRDHRPERSGVAPRRPPAIPALREARMVTDSRALRLALNKGAGARDSTCSPTWTASGPPSRV